MHFTNTQKTHIMKKLILFASLLVVGFAANAQSDQEPNKKKDNKTPGTTQERAINEKGVSVKSRSLNKKSAKANPGAGVENSKKDESKKKEETPKKD